MANTFHLEIVSPEGITFEGEVDEVVLPTVRGEIAVLPHHAPLFTTLTEGEATVKQGNKLTNFALLGGFVEVGRTKVSVLSDFAVRADDIHVAKAEEAKKHAEAVLNGTIKNEDFVLAEKELQKSLFSLRIAEKMKKRTVS